MKIYLRRIKTVQWITLVVLSLSLSALGESRDEPSSVQLLERFKKAADFVGQFEIARELVSLHDTSVLLELVSLLHHEDRHVRGNAAFVFAGLGDNQGFEVIWEILTDRSDRPKGQGIAVAPSDGRYRVKEQIRADRYYAVHLLGDLKDPRSLPTLIPLLGDKEVNYIVPWALAKIGDKHAVKPLIEALYDKDPSVRIIAINALERFGAKEALPRLRELKKDDEKSNFGRLASVAEAATEAIAKLDPMP